MSSSVFSLLSRLLIFSLLPFLSLAGRPCKTILISYYSFSTASDPTNSRLLAVYRFHPVHHHPEPYPVNREPYPVSDDISSSLQDRAKDILIVVAGLLFGLGCGTIAASTMYLVWSLLANRSHIFGSDNNNNDGFGSESESDEESSPKKMGYVKIAPSPAPTAAAVTKEGYEG